MGGGRGVTVGWGRRTDIVFGKEVGMHRDGRDRMFSEKGERSPATPAASSSSSSSNWVQNFFHDSRSPRISQGLAADFPQR